MDFKVVISCNKCECKFELRADSFVKRTGIACPNCLETLPEDVCNHLMNGMQELNLVPENIPESAECSTFTDGKGPNFSLSVVEYNYLHH